MKLFNRMVAVAILLLFEQCIYVSALWEWMRFMPKIGRGGLFNKRRLQNPNRDSSSSSCSLTVSSTVISELLSRVPTLIDDEKKLSLVALSNPAFRSVETVIEYYEQTIPSFVSYFEEAARRPSIVTSASFYSQLISVYASLDSAVRELNLIEKSHPSVSLIQPEMQLLMQTYSSLVTQLKAEMQSSSPSMVTADSAIRHAELTVPNLLTDAINIEAVAIEFPSVTDAIRAIGSYIYTAPPSVDSVISQLLDSSATSVSYLVDASSYETLLNAVKSVAAVLRNSPSMRSPFVDLVDAAESVQGVLNAVDAELSSHDKTFKENLSDLSSLEDSWPPITAAVEWLEILEASNPSLSHALSVIEASLYLSGSIVHQLINAQEYPSLVSDWTAISYARMSHESVVSAVETFLKVQSRHPSIVYTMQAVAYKIFSLETRDRTLLTAIKSIIAETNPSFANAAGGLRTVAYAEPFVAQALQSFQSVVQQSPSLRCDEELVAYYDQYVPQVVQELRDALSSPSTVSSLTSFRTLEDSYSALMSVLRSIYSVESSVSSLTSILSLVNSALVYDPSVTQQWSIIGSLESGLTTKVNDAPLSSSQLSIASASASASTSSTS